MPSISEKFIAKVVDNQDSEMRGRIKVICPDFLGSDETPISSWIEPVHDWGWFTIPDVDEVVEIEIVMASTTDEHRGQSRVWDPDIRWRGRRHWGEIDEGDEATRPAPRPIPDDFKTNYGKRRGFVTPAGHMILFDDTERKESIKIVWVQRITETQINRSTIEFAQDGSVSIADKNGNTVLLKDGSIQITGQTSGEIVAEASQIKLGSGATLGAARLNDPVSPTTGMSTWMSQVAGFINGMAPGTVTPPAPVDFGTISGASSKVNTE